MEQFPQSELSPKEKLEQELAVAQKEYDDFVATEGDAYNKELCDLYMNSSHMQKSAQELYMSACGASLTDVFEAVSGYKKFKEHRSELYTAVLNIQKEIGTLNAHDKQIRDTEEFNTAKEEVTDELYKALDTIYAQIPKQALDSGMKADMALKEFFPNLVWKAQQIEHFIGEVEDAKSLGQLRHARENIEYSKILK